MNTPQGAASSPFRNTALDTLTVWSVTLGARVRTWAERDQFDQRRLHREGGLDEEEPPSYDTCVTGVMIAMPAKGDESRSPSDHHMDPPLPELVLGSVERHWPQQT